MLRNRAKQKFFILFLGLFILSIGGFARAETVDLGPFSQQEFDTKFSNDLSLKAQDSFYTLSADDMQKFIQLKDEMTYDPGYLSEIENADYCQTEKSFICDLLFDYEKGTHIQKISHVYLDQDSLSQYLDGLAKTVDKDPQNASLQVQDGKVSVFSLSTGGIKLDNTKNSQILADYFKQKDDPPPVALAYDVIKPDIATDSIANLGITSLIGEGVSNFAGSPKNRIHNLTIGAQKFNGVLIKPGEEFSFLKTLGPVDASTGYLEELVIMPGKTEPDYGGGMCQVSTTAFRAAINSGLKITDRTPHAYPVSYYNPQGMDATVFIPAPDLKFINNTPGYILIQTKIVGTQLFFDFYGTDDGRKVSIIGPSITQRNPDGSMKANFTQEVTDKNGNQIIDEVFNSNYNSPSNYPHPGQEVLTQKPADWSKKQWEAYKKAHNI